MEEDGERTNFVTNRWSVFTELDAEWNPTKRLVRGYGIVTSEECGHEVEESIITEPIVIDQYHFYHQNEHDNTEYITGSNGKVTNTYTYDVFGNITKSSESVKNRYTYNEEQYDQITQQYYLRARNYNPLIGRFTQEDVYHGDGLNLYAYCGNNPVMYVDPSGYAANSKCGNGSKNQSNDNEGNLNYQLKSQDIDLRGTNTDFQSALDIAFEKTGYPKEQFVVSKWARDINGKSIPVEYIGPNSSMVDIDLPHYGFDRQGNWATGPDAPHIGWEVGRKNSIVGHIILDEVPTGRDYAYSDLRRQIQNMFKGKE